MTFLARLGDTLFGKQPFKLLEIGQASSSQGGSLLDQFKNSFAPSNIFEADAVISEGYSKNATVTTYPVEKGSPIAEHAMTNSFSINISGVTSDASMSYFDIIESAQGSTIGQLFGGTSKSQKTWDILNRWMDEGTPLRLEMKFAKDGFKDTDGSIIPFVIESLSIPRDKSTGAAIRYTMSLRQIKLVTIGSPKFLGPLGIGSIIDKGAQSLGDNNKSGAIGSGSAAVGTRKALFRGGTLKVLKGLYPAANTPGSAL